MQVRDITSRADIDRLVRLFYERVQADKLISTFFSEVVPVNWEEHLPRMSAFWENVLFHTGDYEGDPLVVHRRVSLLHPTTPEHFKRWLDIFFQTVDECFSGPNAEKIKQHSAGIAAVMQQKLNG